MNNEATLSANKNIKKIDLKSIFANHSSIIILILMLIVSSILSPAFLSQRNLTNVLRQMTITTICGFGVTFIIITEGIDLSIGSVVALAGVLATSISVQTGNILLGLLAGMAVGALTGVVNGFFITKFDLPPFIVTLAMMTGARGLVLLYTNGLPVTNIGNFTVFSKGDLLGIPNPVLIMLVVMGIMMVVLNRTRYGRYIIAIGGNETAAKASGIKVKKVKIMTYTLSGTLVGLSGVLLMARINSGQPASGINFEMDAITAAIIGGTSFSGGVGTVHGTLVGGMIVGVLLNILNLTNVSPYWQQILKGFVIMLAVILDLKTKKIKSSTN